MIFQKELYAQAEQITDLVPRLYESVIRSLLDCQEQVLSMENSALFNNLVEYAYDDAQVEKMLILIEIVEYAKKNIFENVLQTYNYYLKEKAELHSLFSKEKARKEQLIAYSKKDLLTSGLLIGTTILVLPNVAPIVAVINVPRVGVDIFVGTSERIIIKQSSEIQKMYESIQPEFYELTDTLRTDYHQSKGIIKALKERASRGEDVITELLLLLNPELMGLNVEYANNNHPKLYRK